MVHSNLQDLAENVVAVRFKSCPQNSSAIIALIPPTHRAQLVFTLTLTSDLHMSGIWLHSCRELQKGQGGKIFQLGGGDYSHKTRIPRM